MNAKNHREKMIELRMSEIMEKAKKGEDIKESLINFRRFVTVPYKHVSNDGYITYVSEEHATCTSLLALHAVDGKLAEKRKNQELSELRAKRAKLNGQGRKRNGVPVTTRSLDGLAVQQILSEDASARTEEEVASRKKEITKRLKGGEDILTGFDKLFQRMNANAMSKGVPVDSPELWTIAAGRYSAAERKILLKLCAPDSKVLSKNEETQLRVMSEKQVSYLSMLSAKEKLTNELSSLWKDQAEMTSHDADPITETETNDDEQSLLLIDNEESVEGDAEVV